MCGHDGEEVWGRLGVVFRKMGPERQRRKSMRLDLHLGVEMETEA